MKTNIKVLGAAAHRTGDFGHPAGGRRLPHPDERGLISGDDEAFVVLSIVSTFIAGLTVVVSVPGIIAGIGLLNLRSWRARDGTHPGFLQPAGIPARHRRRQNRRRCES